MRQVPAPAFLPINIVGETAVSLATSFTAFSRPFSGGGATAIRANLRALQGDPFHAVYAAVAGIHGYGA